MATKANRAGNTLREIRLKVNSRNAGAAEILKDVLVGCGAAPSELVELSQGNHQYILFYPKTAAQTRRIIHALKKIKGPGFRLETKLLFKKDWQDGWKKDFKPFALGKNFFIVPLEWAGKKYKAGPKNVIIIDTAMAFGSGLHETTRFMVELIENHRGRFTSFLDIGTGTGILSIAAIKGGTKEVHAMDYNSDCIKVAKANLKRNNCQVSSLAVADIDHYTSRKQYDFVAANLVTHHLISAARKLVSLVNPGKYLAVSGISLENVPVLQKAFRNYPLRLLKTIKGKEWAAILYQKRQRRQPDAGNQKI